MKFSVGHQLPDMDEQPFVDLVREFRDDWFERSTRTGGSPEMDAWYASVLERVLVSTDELV